MAQSSLSSKLGRSGGRLAALGGEFKRALALVTNPRVPLYLKLLLPVGAVAYWFWPIDLIPGLPIDDVAVLLIALRIFLSLADKALGIGAQAAETVDQGNRDAQVVDGAVIESATVDITTPDNTWSKAEI